MRHKIKTELELEVQVISHVSPATPPRPCSDPDSPAYSDPGDPGERSVEAVLLTNRKTGEFIDITDALSDELLEMLAEDSYEDAMNALDDTP
jgi:hypothetical protein